MELKKYSLVEWTNEADAGSCSVVNSDWILGYTPEMYLIEWREGQGRKKAPPGGWPMGEAKILKTSDKEAELKRELHGMTSIKMPQSELVVTGKRKRIPKKRLYESDDETDTDTAYRSSSGDEKKRGRRGKDEGASLASPGNAGKEAGNQQSASDGEQPGQSQSQSQGQDQTDPSQDQDTAFQETSSDREADDSADDMHEDGHMTDHMDGSEAEYPPEYELSELERLRMEVRGLRDEIMLLRHQVCKELPKVHAIALKALGMQTNNSNHTPSHNHQQQQQQQQQQQSSVRAADTSRQAARPEQAKRSTRPAKRTFATMSNQNQARSKASPSPSPSPVRQVKTKAILKKEAENFRQKIQQERAAGKARDTPAQTRVEGEAQGESRSPSVTRRQVANHKPANDDKVEIYPGTGVFIDRASWDKLCELDQPTAFARRLLPCVFDLETLLSCNLRGGKSTRDVHAEPKQALDQQRVDAIYKAVKDRFPSVRHFQIGQAINGKLSNMRYQVLKRDRDLHTFPSQLPANLLYSQESYLFEDSV